eukprot:6789388-Prymnesium_polylepis.1
MGSISDRRTTMIEGGSLRRAPAPIPRRCSDWSAAGLVSGFGSLATIPAVRMHAAGGTSARARGDVSNIRLAAVLCQPRLEGCLTVRQSPHTKSAHLSGALSFMSLHGSV